MKKSIAPTEKRKSPLFTPSFILLIAGQLISVFGSSILRLALPLYILDSTGSPALFGTLSAIAFLPALLSTPIGGLLADRCNKQHMIVAMDLSTTIMLLAFILLRGIFSPLVLVIILIMFLYALSGIETPTVQSALPILVPKNQLVPANAAVNLVQAISQLLGPVLGGLLYGFWGLSNAFLWITVALFAFAVIIEVILHIPHTHRPSEGGLFATAKADLSEAAHYIFKERPAIAQMIVIASLFNLFVSSLALIGLPVVITQTLGLSSQMYGIAQGVLAAGGILGGILAGTLASKLALSRAFWVLFICAISLLPMAISLLFVFPPLTAYGIILVSSFVLMAAATIFNVLALSLVQKECPKNIVAKVISFIMMLAMCAQPLGQALYGLLFGAFPHSTGFIFLGAAIVTALICLFSRRTFALFKDGIPNQPSTISTRSLSKK